MVTQAVVPSRSTHPRRAQLADATRRALERSLLYSEELDIDLAKQSDSAYFRWFLASLLFGARISETTAKNTYRSFVSHGLTNPEKILQVGWAFRGSGPVPTTISCAGLRRFWGKADPDPLPAVERVAKHLSIDLNRYRRKS